MGSSNSTARNGSHPSPEAGRLGRLAHFTARYRWPVIAAWIVLTLFGGVAAGQALDALVSEHRRSPASRPTRGASGH